MRGPALLLVVILVVGCGATPARDGPSGIEGTVSIGPQCPVEQAGTPCPDAPHAAVITATADGGPAEETRSGPDGRFRMSLGPGTYTVVARPIEEEGIAIGAPVRVVVQAGAYTRVDLSLDSGIR